MRKLYPILFLILAVGCAPVVQHIGTIDFYPTNEWDISMKIYLMPSHRDSDEAQHLALMEKKLIRIIGNSSSYTGLSVVTNPDSADVNVIVECLIDTFLYQTPGYDYSTGYAIPIGNIMVGSNSRVTIPSSTSKKTYLTVNLWFSENNQKEENENQIESPLILLSTDYVLITGQDPFIKAYYVLNNCLFALPGVRLSSFDHAPIIGLPFFGNKFTGLQVQFGETPYFSSFEDKDIVFEIDGERIFDYLDYKAIMLSLNDDKRFCNIRYNRYGKIYSQDVRLKR